LKKHKTNKSKQNKTQNTHTNTHTHAQRVFASQAGSIQIYARSYIYCGAIPGGITNQDGDCACRNPCLTFSSNCTKPNQCSNHGDCIGGVCNCLGGWNGQNCENPPVTTQPPTWYPPSSSGGTRTNTNSQGNGVGDSSQSDGGGLGTAWVIALILAVLLLLFVILGVAAKFGYKYWMAKKRKQYQRQAEEELTDTNLAVLE